MVEIDGLFKALAYFRNIRTINDIIKIIRNDDGWFESEVSVEMEYRKLIRALLFAMIGMYGFSGVFMGFANFYPTQLPFTK